jgi:predicted HicB family RNase H-like nuclease
MAKANSLKDSMKGGLNALLTSTTPKEAPATTQSTAPKKETAVHCNFVINKSIHTRMKYLALEKNMSLRDIVNQAMTEYLERNEK